MAKKRKYSMAELFDGRLHVLKGSDFDDPEKFRKSLYRNWARLRYHARKRLKTRYDGKLLTIQIIPRMSKSTCRVCGRKFIPTIKNRCYCGPSAPSTSPNGPSRGKRPSRSSSSGTPASLKRASTTSSASAGNASPSF